MNPRLMLANSLAQLLVFDKKADLGHDPKDVWPKEVSFRRNTLVCQVAKRSINLGLNAYISHEEDWPIVYVELGEAIGQVSWHIPKDHPIEPYEIPVHLNAIWDGHTREEKVSRVEQFINLLHQAA